MLYFVATHLVSDRHPLATLSKAAGFGHFKMSCVKERCRQLLGNIADLSSVQARWKVCAQALTNSDPLLDGEWGLLSALVGKSKLRFSSYNMLVDSPTAVDKPCEAAQLASTHEPTSGRTVPALVAEKCDDPIGYASGRERNPTADEVDTGLWRICRRR